MSETEHAADKDAHGVMCAGCLQIGLLRLESKYVHLASIESARFCRAEDVLADLRSLLPPRVTASAKDGA